MAFPFLWFLYTFEVVEEPHKQSCFQLFSPLTAADTKFICSFWLISLPFQSVCLSSKFSLWKRNKLQKLSGLKTKGNIWLSLDSHFANLLLILPTYYLFCPSSELKWSLQWEVFDLIEHPETLLFRQRHLSTERTEKPGNFFFFAFSILAGI